MGMYALTLLSVAEASGNRFLNRIALIFLCQIIAKFWLINCSEQIYDVKISLLVFERNWYGRCLIGST